MILFLARFPETPNGYGMDRVPGTRADFTVVQYHSGREPVSGSRGQLPQTAKVGTVDTGRGFHFNTGDLACAFFQDEVYFVPVLVTKCDGNGCHLRVRRFAAAIPGRRTFRGIVPTVLDLPPDPEH